VLKSGALQVDSSFNAAVWKRCDRAQKECGSSVATANQNLNSAENLEKQIRTFFFEFNKK